MIRKKAIGYCVATLLSAMGSSVDASVMVYGERELWEEAVGTFITEDFEALSSRDFVLGTNSAGRVNIEVIGLQGDTGPGKNAIVEKAGIFDVNGSTQLRLETDRDGNDKQLLNIAFNLDAPVIGFGADWDSTTNFSSLTVKIGQDTVKFGDFMVNSGDGFLGFLSDTPFSMVEFDQEGKQQGDTDNEVFGLDDLSIASVVPEPTTLAMIGLGLAGIGYRRYVS